MQVQRPDIVAVRDPLRPGGLAAAQRHPIQHRARYESKASLAQIRLHLPTTGVQRPSGHDKRTLVQFDVEHGTGWPRKLPQPVVQAQIGAE